MIIPTNIRLGEDEDKVLRDVGYELYGAVFYEDTNEKFVSAFKSKEGGRFV